jgi:hypothetical protein
MRRAAGAITGDAAARSIGTSAANATAASASAPNVTAFPKLAACVSSRVSPNMTPSNPSASTAMPATSSGPRTRIALCGT